MDKKIAVQIISKDQVEYIPKMIEATKGFDRFWGLDRCTDNSAALLKSLGEKFVENHEGEGFLAGKMRDLVLDEILKYDYDYVVMFDGDRIPFNLTKELILDEMSKYDATYALAEDDFRRQRKAKMYTFCATAGLIVKVSFIKKVRSLQMMQGRCFHPELDGYCGYEDTIFGACLYGVGASAQISSMVVSGIIPSGAKYDKEVDWKTFIRLISKVGIPIPQQL